MLKHGDTIDETNRDEWLAYRRHSIGGSIAAKLMTGSLYSAWEEMTGKTKQEARIEMKLGLFLEPFIALLYEEETKQEIERIQVFLVEGDAENSWAHATIDAITTAGEVLDFKVVGPYAKEWGDGGDDVPEYIVWQAQHNLRVADKPYMDIPAYFVPYRFQMYRVHADATLQQLQLEREQELAEYILAGTEPEPTEEDDEYRARRYRSAMGVVELTGEQAIQVQIYADLNAQIKAAEAKKDDLKPIIEKILGDAKKATWVNGTVTRVHVPAKPPVMKLVEAKEKNYFQVRGKD